MRYTLHFAPSRPHTARSSYPESAIPMVSIYWNKQGGKNREGLKEMTPPPLLPVSNSRDIIFAKLSSSQPANLQLSWALFSVRSTYQKLDPQMKSNLTFSVGWVGWWSGWMVGDLESKANLSSSCS